MLIKLKQKKLKWNFKYEITVNNLHLFIAEANRIITPKFRQINLMKDDNQTISTVVETSKYYKILTSIPIIANIVTLFIGNTYDIIENGEKVGNIIAKDPFLQSYAIVKYKGNDYKIYAHTGGRKGKRYSIFNNNNQVGRIIINPYRHYEADTFIGEFDHDTDVILNVLVMTLIDIKWHTEDINTEMHSHSWSYEWWFDMIFGVKYNEGWKPKHISN